MNNEIKYNVNSILKTNEKTKEEISKTFNEKLLKVIMTLEKTKNVSCQN